MSYTPEQLEARELLEKHVVMAFLVATWIFVILRIYVRGRLIRVFGWDDTWMILAQLMFTLYCAFFLVLLSYGGNTAIMNYDMQTKITNWSIATFCLYIATICFLKVSLGLLFNRIVIKKWQRFVVYATVAVSTLTSIAVLFFIVFRCGTDVGDFLPRMIAGHCAPRSISLVFLYLHGAINVATDWIFATLPIPVLWNANMGTRTKVSFGFILALGAVGSICSIVRCFYINGAFRREGFFWNSATAATWSTIEPGIGIIVASLATMHPLFRILFREARDLSSRYGQPVTNLSKQTRRSLPFRPPPPPTSTPDESLDVSSVEMTRSPPRLGSGGVKSILKTTTKASTVETVGAKTGHITREIYIRPRNTGSEDVFIEIDRESWYIEPSDGRSSRQSTSLELVNQAVGALEEYIETHGLEDGTVELDRRSLNTIDEEDG
ncbi:uncharacterized protein BDZ99DRAFT_465527 [Mytilinidion resinicola]|uniref:Rhodopsin domain-containing protein n=1 Tax=Mytilinidion resinicola TaxID=574789 RepID=A0A6A6YD35_9PEZI|nr:uncharacterized protein BDZ99DRAFT_465527 [Mytilinidion resinicola]KAF2806732.1 hypothetical protein BDZ99DRAFT_465527 [Mytilinidion resinicola]